MPILDIRGTHGSGKTYLVRSLLDYGNKELKENGKLVGHYVKKFDCGIVGPYRGDASGGCDCISPVARIVELVEKYNERYTYVVLEGILVAHTFQRYHELANKLGDYRFLFLNTPLSTCIGRVLERRHRANTRRKFKSNNIRSDYKQIWIRTRQKLEGAGHYVKVLDWKDPLPAVLWELKR